MSDDTRTAGKPEKPLRILHLEDVPADAELVQAALESDGIPCTITWVKTRNEFENTLRTNHYDLILSDYRLPDYDGITALRFVKAEYADTPFIFISGTMGEDAAIQSLTEGGTDYVLKQNLARLGPVIKRELIRAKERQERKRAEENLLLKNIVFEASIAANSIADMSGIIIEANKAFLSLWGYSNKDEVIGKPLPDFFQKSEETGALLAVLNESGRWAGEFSARRKDGSTFTAYGQATDMRDSTGKLIGYQSSVTDITERKQAENALRESETKYTSLVSNVPDIIFIVDLEGKLTFANQRIKEILEYDSAEAINMNILNFIPAEDRQRTMETLQKGMKGEKVIRFQTPMISKSGKRLFCECSFTRIYKNGALIGAQGTASDITERKRAENANLLRARWSEALLQLLQLPPSSETEIVVNAIEALVALTESKLCFVGVVDSEETAMSGHVWSQHAMQECAVAGKKTVQFDVTHGGLWTAPIRQHQAIIVNDYAAAHPLKKGCPAGHVSLTRYVGVPVIRGGRAVLVAGLANKVEEYNEEEVNETVMFMEGIWGVLNRNRAEEAIASLNLKNELILNSAAEGILGLDLQGNHTFVNPAAARMLGYESEELLGRPGHSCWHHSRPDGSPFPKEDCPILITGLNGVEHRDFNALFWRKDGTGFPVEYVSTPILEQRQVTGVVVTFSDISERKQAEEKVRASLQEKEVLLQEIHHRVKNNLQIISGLLTLQADQSAGKTLDDIFRTSQDRIRSMALIHEKLYSSHSLAEIDFSHYLRSLVEGLFAAHSVEAGRITARYEMESIFFHIEKAMPLGLIANELVANSLKHAFPAGRQGEIRITLQERTGTARRAPTDQGCAPTCELIIADNGIGLPAGFKPNKQKSLGMHLVSMLAKQIQAEFKVKTGPGTEFRFVFSGQPANAAGKDKDHGG